MIFRRKKKQDTDQTVLTHALRSLQDLIDDPTQSRENGPDAESSDGGSASSDQTPPPTQPLVESTGPDPAPAAQAESNGGTGVVEPGDDLPVLTNVVYMPIPRHAATASQPQEYEPEHPAIAAQEAMAAHIMHSLEQRLDTKGQTLDAELAQELRDAVRTSLEDWSARTQEILLKQLAEHTRKTSGRS